MRLFLENRWAYSLGLSLFCIVIGSLVRCDKLSIDTFKPKNVEAPKASSTIEGKKSEKSEVDSRANREAETENTVDRDQSGIQKDLPHNTGSVKLGESPISRLKVEMTRQLAERGFTSYESEQAIQSILNTFEANEGKGVDSISLAIEEASKSLKLDAARKDQLRTALFESFNESGGAFTIDDFHGCVAKRAKFLGLNECASNLLNQFSEEFAESVKGYEKITLKMQNGYSAFRERYVTLSKSCGIDQALAERVFAPMLSDCPN